jgi:hypothetical protein
MLPKEWVYHSVAAVEVYSDGKAAACHRIGSDSATWAAAGVCSVPIQIFPMVVAIPPQVFRRPSLTASTKDAVPAGEEAGSTAGVVEAEVVEDDPGRPGREEGVAPGYIVVADYP